MCKSCCTQVIKEKIFHCPENNVWLEHIQTWSPYILAFAGILGALYLKKRFTKSELKRMRSFFLDWSEGLTELLQVQSNEFTNYSKAFINMDKIPSTKWKNYRATSVINRMLESNTDKYFHLFVSNHKGGEKSHMLFYNTFSALDYAISVEANLPVEAERQEKIYHEAKTKWNSSITNFNNLIDSVMNSPLEEFPEDDFLKTALNQLYDAYKLDNINQYLSANPEQIETELRIQLIGQILETCLQLNQVHNDKRINEIIQACDKVGFAYILKVNIFNELKQYYSSLALVYNELIERINKNTNEWKEKELVGVSKISLYKPSDF